MIKYLNNDKTLLSRRSQIIMSFLVVAMPFLGSLAGAFVNPTGWASSNPIFGPLLILAVLINYWYVTLAFSAVITYLMVKKRQNLVIIIMFSLSLLCSIGVAIYVALVSDYILKIG